MANNRNNNRNSYRIGAGCRVKRKAPSMQVERAIIQQLGEASLYLFRYYANKATEIWIDLLDDGRIGMSIGWGRRKVQHHRLRLQKAGWIMFETHTKDGIKYNHMVRRG